MNNNFYILPNKEGYLVKSCDNNNEIALFKSRYDAEIFIKSVTLSSTTSFLDDYSFKVLRKNFKKQKKVISQHSSQLQQFISPYYINEVFLPQTFFVQSDSMVQQILQSQYPLYSIIMPAILPIKKIYCDMYSNCYKMNNINSNINYYCKYRNFNNHKCFKNYCSYNKNKKKFKLNSNNLDNKSYVNKNKKYKNKTIDQCNKKNNFNLINKQNKNNFILNKKLLEQQENDISLINMKPETTSLNFKSEKFEQNDDFLQNKNDKQYFVSNSGFTAELLKQSKKENNLSSTNFNDDNNFSDFIKKQEFNNNFKISKKEIKKLMKNKLKEIKIQEKFRKYNNKKNYNKILFNNKK